IEKARRRHAAVTAIRDLGGDIRYDYELSTDRNSLPNTPPGSPWLRKLLPDEFFADVYEVKFDWTLPFYKQTINNLSDSRWRTDAQIHQNARVVNEGLRHVRELPELRT